MVANILLRNMMINVSVCLSSFYLPFGKTQIQHAIQYERNFAAKCNGFFFALVDIGLVLSFVFPASIHRGELWLKSKFQKGSNSISICICPAYHVCSAYIRVMSHGRYGVSKQPWAIDSLHRGPLTRKAFPCRDVIMVLSVYLAMWNTRTV